MSKQKKSTKITYVKGASNLEEYKKMMNGLAQTTAGRDMNWDEAEWQRRWESFEAAGKKAQAGKNASQA